eukprot:GHUV01033932.1.p1 GENE.GHUV01033932.1~~GHUV01033932.1.p1  ORF type:complete len:145 (+),score=8.88 GHUV01033932.1:703-1137(+)
MPTNTKQRKVPQVSLLQLKHGSTVVNLLGTTGVQKPVGSSAASWISYWEKYRCQLKTCCCAQGCYRTDRLAGGHVKAARGPTAALHHTKWYIVPVCPEHNKGSSCKTFKVKAVIAVEAPPTRTERILSWQADISKLLRSIAGKR